MKATTPAELITEMEPHVRRFIFYKLRGIPFIATQDMEDIVQEALLRAHTAKKPCDPSRSDAEIRAWFVMVARTSIGHFFQAKVRKKRAGATYPIEDHTRHSHTPTPLERDVEQDRCEDILKVIRGMPPIQRNRILADIGIEERTSHCTFHSERTQLNLAKKNLHERLVRAGIITAGSAQRTGRRTPGTRPASSPRSSTGPADPDPSPPG